MIVPLNLSRESDQAVICEKDFTDGMPIMDANRIGVVSLSFPAARKTNVQVVYYGPAGNMFLKRDTVNGNPRFRELADFVDGMLRTDSERVYWVGQVQEGGQSPLMLYKINKLGQLFLDQTNIPLIYLGNPGEPRDSLRLVYQGGRQPILISNVLGDSMYSEVVGQTVNSFEAMQKQLERRRANPEERLRIKKYKRERLYRGAA